MNLTIVVIVSILLICFLITLSLDKFPPKKQIIQIQNPLSGEPMMWENSEFVRSNSPNYNFDIHHKKKVLEYTLKNKPGFGVIDVGAHIGDLSIPLGHALTSKGRHDVMIHAFDPSPQKCKFIRHMVTLNRLSNIKIRNCGLSDKYSLMGIDEERAKVCQSNTGGHMWKEGGKDPIRFIPLDFLMNSMQIGVFHIDVEGHEVEVLKGAKKLIQRDKPVLLIEVWDCSKSKECTDKWNKTLEIIIPGYRVTGVLPNGDFICEFQSK